MEERKPYARGMDMPNPRVSYKEKQQAKWYEGTIDYIISKAVSANNKRDLEKAIRIQRGDIPDEFYDKTLNPYNVKEEKLKRFPATMRNYDIMNDSIRRYASEYIKAVHEFIVTHGTPEIAFNRDGELKSAISAMAQQAFVVEFQNKLQEQIQQGVPKEQINVESLMPSPEEFLAKFEQDRLDDMSVQAQGLLDTIDTVANTDMVYAEIYKDYVAFGECYSYINVDGNKLVIESVPLLEAYPVKTNNFFREDDDMFARKQYVTYNQIYQMYDDTLSGKDREWLDKYYNKGLTSSPVHWYDVVRNYPERCEKYTEEDMTFFEKDEINLYSVNQGMYEHWRVNWRGWARAGIVTRINEIGAYMQDTVEDGYVMNPMAGDIDIKWEWVPCIYEGVRIGTERYGIYPIKCRPVHFAGGGKLCFNGINEVIKGLGHFSIVESVTPLQIFRNIIGFHMEMTIAKSKLLNLIMAKSLLGTDVDKTVYQMEASGMLLYDDTVDGATGKAQAIKAAIGGSTDYVTKLRELMTDLKNEARELVDMTPQRYGEIATNAGKSTTEEAIARGSMGSVILVFMFDKMRERDYQKAIEATKFAWIDGMDTHYMDKNQKPAYFSLDVNEHVMRDYQVMVKNSAAETEKRDQLKSWAFNAGQNGDFEIAAEAIQTNSTVALVRAIKQFGEIKRQHENELEQLKQQLEETKQKYNLDIIHAKGVEDRETEVIKGLIAQDEAATQLDAEMMKLLATFNNTQGAPDNSAELGVKERIENNKLKLEERKLGMQAYDNAANRAIERERIGADLKIARTNKNKYDK